MSSAIPIPQSQNAAQGGGGGESSGSSMSSSPGFGQKHHRRRSSLLSTSLQTQTHTIFDLGTRDGHPRLVTCVKTGQGFDWNQEMFLPAHMHSSCTQEVQMMNHHEKVERVHEIVLDGEEEELLP